MHCPQCQYSLWDLRQRRCPECGAGFRPSEFDFVPGAVRFACPGCEQVYYGTSARGHLRPAAFACVRCARQLKMDDMVLTPAPGAVSEPAARRAVPWEDRAALGRRRAFTRTLRWSLTRADLLARRLAETRSRGRVRGSLWFALGVFALTALANGTTIYAFSVMLSAGQQIPGGIATCGVGVIAVVVLAMVALLLEALVWYALARWVWRRRVSLGEVITAGGYSAGPWVLLAIPVLGVVAAPVAAAWHATTATALLRRRSGLGSARALGVALPLLVLLAAPLTYAVLTWGSQWNALGWNPFRTRNVGVLMGAHAPTRDEARKRAERLARSIDGTRGLLGKMPLSAFHAEGVLTIKGIVATATRRDPFEEGVNSFGEPVIAATSDPETRQRLLAKVEATRPARPAAHRICDAVFCFEGTDSAPEPEKIWRLMLGLGGRPVMVDGSPIADEYLVVIGAKTVVSYTAAELRTALAEQNALRQAGGLPLVPLPWYVGEDAWVAAETVLPDGRTTVPPPRPKLRRDDQ